MNSDRRDPTSEFADEDDDQFETDAGPDESADPYEVLGLTSAATPDEIRQTYFRLVRRYSPEAHPKQFKRIRAAYDALKSPIRRAQLALTRPDESVDQVDDSRLAIPQDDHPDFFAALLAVELAESDFDLERAPLGKKDSGDRPKAVNTRRFADDVTPIDERGLLALSS
jgi:curved DNA-binding protein CbpA